MSLAGLKKQINKANQFMSEKIAGVKGTELDDEFLEMERRTDATAKLVDDVINRTQEYLQPNPGRCFLSASARVFVASRAKLWTVNSISKIRGQTKNAAYPQPEGILGDTMLKHGRDLGETSNFGLGMIEAGEALKQMADVKYALEDNVKQNFLEPLHQLKEKELKEVAFHRKKLSGRRLDYDCKRRKQAKGKGEPAGRHGAAAGSSVGEEEIRAAEEKFEESKNLAETAMFNLLENDVEQICQLASFSEALYNYHRQCGDILQGLVETLSEKRQRAAQQSRDAHVPKRVTSQREENSHRLSPSAGSGSSSLNSLELHPPVSQSAFQRPASPGFPPSSPSQRPYCKGVYDFDAENDGELSFHEGEVIYLLSRIDENWFEGELHGTRGLIPVNYVEVVVDVPKAGSLN